jgi:hypothetical protein
VNYYQNHWDQYLHIVEYAINDTMNSTTGYTPFYLYMGRHPTSLLDLAQNPNDTLSARDMRAVYDTIKNNVAVAQNKMAKYANRHQLADPFKVGEYVLLTSKPFTTPNERGRQSAKFGPAYYGPYKIIEKIGTSYKLEFPFSWSVHDVFHPDKLRPYYYNKSKPAPFSSLPQAQRQIEREIHCNAKVERSGTSLG